MRLATNRHGVAAGHAGEDCAATDRRRVRAAGRRLVEDAELAYAMTRYREIHDFLHVLTGLPPTVEGELALKTLEAVRTRA